MQIIQARNKLLRDIRRKGRAIKRLVTNPVEAASAILSSKSTANLGSSVARGAAKHIQEAFELAVGIRADQAAARAASCACGPIPHKDGRAEAAVALAAAAI